MGKCLSLFPQPRDTIHSCFKQKKGTNNEKNFLKDTGGVVWLRDRADLAQTLFPLSASAFRYCRSQCFYSPQNLSPWSLSWLSQHTLFLPLPCFLSRGGSWSTSAMRNTKVRQSPLLGHLSTSSSQSVLLKGWMAAADLNSGKGLGVQRKKRLCSGLRAKHFNFYVWNYRLGFYFDETKDFLCYLLAFKQIANLESASVQYSFTPSVAVPAALQVVFNPLGLGGTLQ